jgi:hypothetical protein
MTGAGTDAYALGQSDLNRFLFAEVGEEQEGMPLSVLSALARLGLDPWQEARRLANLPARAAVEGLAQVIAGMPASPWPLPDATLIAERLVGLLPRQGGGAAMATGSGPGFAAGFAPGRKPGLAQARPPAAGSLQARRLALGLIIAAAVLAVVALRFVG